jgi:hypothetical protein
VVPGRVVKVDVVRDGDGQLAKEPDREIKRGIDKSEIRVKPLVLEPSKPRSSVLRATPAITHPDQEES